MKVLHYINQFFGQKGGEEMAHIGMELVEGPVGPGVILANLLKDKAELTHTVICGDSWFNENQAVACQGITEILEQVKPDLVIAGPAFNAGRYGMACGAVAKTAKALGIPTVTGMYPENPGFDVFKTSVYCVETGNSAAAMRTALPAMAELAKQYLDTGDFGYPEESGYMPRGVRVNYFAERNGAERAVDILLAKLEKRPFTSEFQMPVYDKVAPQPPVVDLTKATIAVISSGGVIPKGNPDRLESSSASKFGTYDIAGLERLDAEHWESIHGGYDPVYANDDPNRVTPLDVMRDLEREGKIGKLYEKIFVTVGTGTPVSNSEGFGRDIAMLLQKAGVTAAILTST